jgi:hypothetical protein
MEATPVTIDIAGFSGLTVREIDDEILLMADDKHVLAVLR